MVARGSALVDTNSVREKTNSIINFMQHWPRWLLCCLLNQYRGRMALRPLSVENGASICLAFCNTTFDLYRSDLTVIK
jgi:hypothetical protein